MAAFTSWADRASALGVSLGLWLACLAISTCAQIDDQEADKQPRSHCCSGGARSAGSPLRSENGGGKAHGLGGNGLPLPLPPPPPLAGWLECQLTQAELFLFLFLFVLQLSVMPWCALLPLRGLSRTYTMGSTQGYG